MNKIVREHYPVSKLPDDLKELLSAETVKVVIEEEQDVKPQRSSLSYRDHFEEVMADIKPMTWKELYADWQAHPERYSGNVTPEEAVAWVRELRDEWNDDR